MTSRPKHHLHGSKFCAKCGSEIVRKEGKVNYSRETGEPISKSIEYQCKRLLFPFAELGHDRWIEAEYVE